MQSADSRSRVCLAWRPGGRNRVNEITSERRVAELAARALKAIPGEAPSLPDSVKKILYYCRVVKIFLVTVVEMVRSFTS